MSDSVRLVRRHLTTSLTPGEMLRLFREQPGLVGLVGGWNHSRAVVGFAPAYAMPIDADPFVTVGRLPLVTPTPRPDGAFGGGWVGAFGYQLGRLIEDLPPSPHRPVARPTASLAYYDHVLVHSTAGWEFEALIDDGNHDRIEAQYAMVKRSVCTATAPACDPEPFSTSDFAARPDARGHERAVQTTLDHLAAGDIFQANICRRLEADFSGDPLDVFCAGLDRLAPAYAAFLRTDQGAVVSFSPELFLRRQGRSVTTSPIKGTAPLESDVEELTASTKNRAENVMIVDLMRNDLGRVCRPGSITVGALARAEQHTGVWHLVSDVTAELAEGEDDTSLLRATFPPGSVTGAPKVRAMEIINAVEVTGRETYTGAIGFVSPLAGLELSVAIRTFEFSADQVWLGVGGGVVIDSTPHGELVETLVKAAPLLSAIGARLDPAELATTELLTAPKSRMPLPGRHSQPLLPVDETAGVFTTLLVRDRTPINVEQHLARLGASVSELYGDALPADLADRALNLAGAVRGPHRLRINAVPHADEALDITLSALPLGDRATEPWRLVPVEVVDGLGRHKWHDRRRLAALEPASGAWDGESDALVCDRDGAVLETGRGNLFMVTDNAVHTPALDGRLLPGVVRQRVIERVREHGIPLVERAWITLADLAGATEVFTTGSLSGVRPVGSVAGVGVWAPGPTTAWLASTLDAPHRPTSEPPLIGLPGRGLSILLIDNYDSFVYNLDQYLRELGARTVVVRNDRTTVDEIAAAVGRDDFQGVVISPGPGTPDEAGVSTAVVAALGHRLPILGVCLGHQCIAVAYGGVVARATTVMHGRQSLVHHDGAGVFAGLDGPLLAGRYHSLSVVEALLPAALAVTARTADGTVMGLRHRVYGVEGIQLHPESVLTDQGHRMLASFLHTCASRAISA